MKLLSTYGALIILLTLISIELYRANYIGMTSDEGYSYTRYVEHPYINIITYTDIVVLPNNHIFNTVGMKFFSSIFGINPFVLRLTNLLAFAFCCMSFWRWMKESVPYQFHLFFAIILFFNPYVLDFFMLARGYGLGMSMMLMSLFYFERLRAKNEIKLSDYYPPLILAALSVWANFAFLNYYLGFILVMECLMVYRVIHSSPSTKVTLYALNVPVAVVTLVLFAAIFWPMYQILNAHQLYGGMDGFWQNTVQSLIARTFYEANYPLVFTKITEIIVAFSVALFAIIILYNLKSKTEILVNPLFHTGLLLLLPVCANIGEHWLFHTEFPEDRTAVFYIPLYMFFLMHLLRYFQSRSSLVIAIAMASALCINVYLNLNFEYVWEWKYDVNTGKMMKELQQMLKNCEGARPQINLGCNPLFEPSISYYRIYLNLDCVYQLNRDGLVKGINYDYVYILNNDPRFKKTENFKTIEYYPVSESQLLKNVAN